MYCFSRTNSMWVGKGDGYCRLIDGPSPCAKAVYQGMGR